MTRVLVACSGLDHVNRGYETFARELVAVLRAQPGIDAQLLKGSGPPAPAESTARCVSRYSRVARLAGRLTRWDHAPYVVEQFTFAWTLHRRARHVDVVLTSDKPSTQAIHGLRRVLGGRYAIVFSNGAPYQGPFPWADLVHQVTPVQLERSQARGEQRSRQRLVPYGIGAPALPVASTAHRQQRRAELKLPTDGPLIIAVGALNRSHKRHDHLMHEVASLADLNPMLVILGERGAETEALLSHATATLGDRVVCRRAAPEAVAQYLQAADVFALASTTEGFGRAYAEAALAGLPCVVHDFEVARFVLGHGGYFVDMTEPGAAAAALRQVLTQPPDPEMLVAQQHDVATRFSWEALAPSYVALVNEAAALAAGAEI